MSEHIIQCWSCGTSTTLNEIRTADGYCPECEVEIDLAEYYPKLAEAHDALHAEAEGLRAENERLIEYSRQQQEHQEKTEGRLDAVTGERNRLNNHCVELRAELEAARGLLREAKDGLDEYWMTTAEGIAAVMRIDTFLTATPAPEGQPAVKYSLTAHGEQGERQQAVHWRAVLDPAEVPMQLNPHEHIAGFTDRRKAEDWIAARLCMDGWHYTLEPLYASPPPAQDVSGRPVVLATLYRDADGNPGCKFVGDPEMRIRDGDALMAVTQYDRDVSGLVEALEHARMFIRNGVELGFIRMPDADTPDTAHDTLPKIEAALATYRKETKS